MVDGKPSHLIDGGSKVCVMGDLHQMVDVAKIEPIPILVAWQGASSIFNNCITKRGLLPLTPTDGTPYYQPCFYCANMVKSIISPAAVLNPSNTFFYWTQIGCKDPTAPGILKFTSRDGSVSMTFNLVFWDGLYY
jgi:hypothetical protein